MFLNIELDKSVYSDQDKLTDLLAPIFWRTRKSQVLDQIRVPPQSEEVHWLNFSPVEEHFYKQQAIDCAHDALERLNKIKRSQVECEEAQRLRVAAANGLAAIHIIKKEYGRF